MYLFNSCSCSLSLSLSLSQSVMHIQGDGEDLIYTYTLVVCVNVALQVGHFLCKLGLEAQEEQSKWPQGLRAVSLSSLMHTGQSLSCVAMVCSNFRSKEVCTFLVLF